MSESSSIRVDYTSPITIATPFYNSMWSMKRYLKCLSEYDFPKRDIRLVFVDNQSVDATWQMLYSWGKKHGEEYNGIELMKLKRQTNPMVHSTLVARHNICRAVTLLCQRAVNDLILIGSDNGGPPDSILRLLRMRNMEKVGVAAGLTIVCAHKGRGGLAGWGAVPGLTAFNFSDEIQNGHRMFEHIGLNSPADPHWVAIAKKDMDKVMDVDAVGTGLAIVIPEVYKGFNPKLIDDYGEDMQLCVIAKKLGYRVLCDTGFWYLHWHYSYVSVPNERGLFFKVLGSNKRNEKVPFRLPRTVKLEKQTIKEAIESGIHSERSPQTPIISA